MFLYVFWALLPAGFLVLLMKSSWRRARGRLSASETPIDHLSQFVFTAAALAVAIVLNEFSLDAIMSVLTSLGFLVEKSVVSWLIYPAVLLCGALVNEFVKPKKKPIGTMPGSRYVRP